MLDSKHTEAIALICQLAGTDKSHGITVKEIHSKLGDSATLKSVYRVVAEEDLGFFKSRWPMRPQGYYYDETRAMDSIASRVSQSVISLTTAKRAIKITEEANALFDSFSPIGKMLCHVTLGSETDKKIIEGCNKWTADSKFTKKRIEEFLSDNEELDSLKGYIILSAIAVAQGRVFE